MVRKDKVTPVLIFKILADPNRYELLVLLYRAKLSLSVGDIAQSLNMTHSAVSHQLGNLHELSIVIYKRHGREMRYSFAKTPIARKVSRLLTAIA
jgi:ArsR family transcriptional regulator